MNLIKKCKTPIVATALVLVALISQNASASLLISSEGDRNSTYDINLLDPQTLRYTIDSSYPISGVFIPFLTESIRNIVVADGGSDWECTSTNNYSVCSTFPEIINGVGIIINLDHFDATFTLPDEYRWDLTPDTMRDLTATRDNTGAFETFTSYAFSIVDAQSTPVSPQPPVTNVSAPVSVGSVFVLALVGFRVRAIKNKKC